LVVAAKENITNVVVVVVVAVGERKEERGRG